MESWTIRSIKHTEEFDGDLNRAIDRAAQINLELQPAYGVQIENAHGDTVWDSESDEI